MTIGSLGEYHKIGTATIFLGDYRDLMHYLPNVTIVIADPPYGNDYRQKRSRDKWVRPDAELPPIQGNAEPFDPTLILALGKKTILWGANYYANKLPPASKWLIWDKRENTTPDDGADVELAWTNLKGVPRMYRHLWRGIIRRGEENISTGAKKLHPNQKPVALMNWCLNQAQATPKDLVMDTHMGSGTTGVACMRQQIPFVGIEIDPHYYAIALQRLLQEEHKLHHSLPEQFRQTEAAA